MASYSFFSSPGSSFVDNDDSVVCCEVCFEPFRPSLRPPKLLPCGHNFCEQCLLSMYVHHKYYLVNPSCPTCRTSFPPNSFLTAPTNFDLCKLLESSSRRDANVTVIRLHGQEESMDKSYVLNTTSTTKKSRKEALIRCVDCGKRLSEKTISRTARSCRQCNAAQYLELSCLECCVDVHNGHTLVSRSQVEEDQSRAAHEQSRLHEMAVEMAHAVRTANMAAVPLSRLAAAQECTVREALSELSLGLDLLNSSRLLAPLTIHNIRKAACQHVGKVSTLVKVIENEFATLRAGDRKSLSGSQLRQSRLRLRGSDSLARESMAAVLSVLPSSSNHSAALTSILSSISPQDRVDERLVIYLRACEIITQCLSAPLHSSAIPVISDAFVHIFHEINELSRKRIGGTSLAGKHLNRQAIWKHVQMGYSELLRVVSKQFDSRHSGRVDVIDDLSFICRLYADIADQASLTLCMIEAARARAAEADPDRLKVIDDNLVECRRQQKLNALRQNTDRGCSLFRLFTSCVKGRRQEDHNTTVCM